MDDLLRATAEAEGRHFWFRGFRAFMRPLVARAIGDRADARILDCGCGTGANLEMLGRFGRAFGIDLSEVGLLIGRKAGRGPVVRAAVTVAPFLSDSFDLVTSFDVLYALDDPDAAAAMAEMFRLTRPGGHVLINVAAMRVLHGDHSILSGERRRYSRPELGRLVTGAGFAIERLTYTNASLFVPIAVMRMGQRWRGLASDSRREISVPTGPVNALLTGVVLVESIWIRYFDAPFGSSLVCLAKKPAGAESRRPAAQGDADPGRATSSRPARRTGSPR